MWSSAAKKAVLFRELNCEGQDMVPSGSRNTHARLPNLPAFARRNGYQRYKETISTGLPSPSAAMTARASTAGKKLIRQ
jgi:hypothetical protein